jgi:hypothetical protein
LGWGKVKIFLNRKLKGIPIFVEIQSLGRGGTPLTAREYAIFLELINDDIARRLPAAR